MARPATAVQLTHPLSEPPLSNTEEFPHSPGEINEQLARVDALHLQLKAETIRAQEFLLKLRQEEIDYFDQLGGKTNPPAPAGHHDDTGKQHTHQHKDKKGQNRPDKKDLGKASKVPHQHEGSHNAARGSNSAGGSASRAKSHKDSSCRCGCPHHPLSPESEAQLKKLADQYHVPTSLNTHVDEREVRDLEKRVRGLEGRVRGFEGLPPDREIALLEVERLRRELEGLARRRDGLFEGLSGHFADYDSGKKIEKSMSGTGKALGNRQGNSKANANGNASGTGKK